MKGITGTGFEFDVDLKRLDDYELLEDLADMTDGKEGKIVSVINRLLGEEQKEKLKITCEMRMAGWLPVA